MTGTLRYVIRKKPTVVRCIIRKLLTLDDMVRLGFRKTGIVRVERTPYDLGVLLRKWAALSESNHEKKVMESEIASAGWFQPPPSWEEMLRRYPPKTPPASKNVKKEAPKVVMVIVKKKMKG